MLYHAKKTFLTMFARDHTTEIESSRMKSKVRVTVWKQEIDTFFVAFVLVRKSSRLNARNDSTLPTERSGSGV